MPIFTYLLDSIYLFLKSEYKSVDDPVIWLYYRLFLLFRILMENKSLANESNKQRRKKKSKFLKLFKKQPLYKSASLSVSLFVCWFPNSSETANPSELKFWGMIPLGMEKVLG